MKLQFLDYQSRLKILAGDYYNPLCWIVTLLLGLLVLMWAVLPYSEWREDQQAHMQQDLQKAGRLQALQKSVKQWQSADTDIKTELDKQIQGYFNAPSYLQAQQDLFNLINAQLKQNQLKLMTHSFLESTEVAAGEQVAVQINIQGNLSDIISFIDVFSNHQKFLTFSNLSIIKNNENAILQLAIAGYRLKVKAP